MSFTVITAISRRNQIHQRTNLDSLKWILNHTEITSRFARWHLRLLEFDVDIEQRAGTKPRSADTLSRLSTSGEVDILLKDDLPPLIKGMLPNLGDRHICVIDTTHDDIIQIDNEYIEFSFDTPETEIEFIMR